MSRWTNLVSFLLLGVSAWAQSASVGQISGTVHDATGLSVPAAQVTATQTDTGLVRTAQTGADGVYQLPSLPIGPYRLEVSRNGFSTYVQSGIILQVDSHPTVDVALKVGSVAEQVQVEAAAAMVETHSTGVGTVVDSQRVVELPLNGRNATQLINLAGAAVTIPLGNAGQLYSGKNQPQEAPIAVAGGGANSAVTYVMDGGSHNDPINNLGLPLPFPDALQEFKVETSALPAQYGQHGSGAVSVVTKSGTNEIHGDAFEFVRNAQFNARDFFAQERDSLKRNQLGGTVGGAILKNKLFFFGGTQFTLQRSAPTVGTNFIPTPAMLQGDFTAVASAACNGGRPVTLRAPFVNNKISPSLLSPQAVKMTTFGYGTAEDACGTVHFGARNNLDEQQGIGRLDYQVSDRHSLFGRYYAVHTSTPPSYTGTPLSITAPFTDNLVTSIVLGDTYIINPNTINTLRGTFNRSSIVKNQVPFFGAADIGVQGIYETIPKYLLVSVTNALYSAAGATYPGYLFTTSHQVADDFSMIRGKHQIQIGGNYIRPVHNIWIYLNAAGAFTFNGQTTGLSMGDFLTGKPATFAQNSISLDFERQRYFGGYAQDTWRATPHLTVSYGLRWEPYFGNVIQQGWVSHFEMEQYLANQHSSVYPNAPAGTLFPGDKGFNTGNRPMNPKLNSWAPRIGLVWDPKGNGKMTVRASWGMFYDMPSTLFYYGYSNEAPWGQAVTINNPVGGFSDPWQGYPGGNRFPVTFNKNSSFPTGGSYVTVPLNYHPPYMNNWNFSVDRQFGSNWLAKASYLGTNTIHFWSPKALNPSVYIPGASCVINGQTFAPCSTTGNVTQRRTLTLQNPQQGAFYNTIATLDDGGTTSYNGLLLSLQKRLANHFTVQTNYTWSHCIADLGTTLLAGSYTDPNDRRFDRGNCAGTDVRHNFNLSAVAETPKFHGQLLQAVAGDWRLSVITSTRSGINFTATSGIDLDLNGIAGDRANQILPNPYCAQKGKDCWLNGSAFAPAVANGVRSNMGPYSLVGPNFFNMDLGLTKTIRLGESHHVDLRAEVFNVQNRVNFLTNSPINVSAPNAGSQNGSSFGKLLYDASPRIMQFALKYQF